ncbi:hypothetical protein [Nostoc sp.]|uniref:hypothetical protein n=1 Tax=Nostoc sp. TaxID=1180 RepID=UPI002FF4721E
MTVQTPTLIPLYKTRSRDANNMMRMTSIFFTIKPRLLLLQCAALNRMIQLFLTLAIALSNKGYYQDLSN